MKFSVSDVYLCREHGGMMRVAIKIDGVWVEVISDNSELASHSVTSEGIKECLDKPETKLELELNKSLGRLIY